jgi:IS605 OrfB family transposase
MPDKFFFKENRLVTQGELCGQMKWNRHFNAMYASSAQQICNGLIESFKSFKQWLKLSERGIRVPLGRKVKAWFGLEDFYIPMATHLDWNSIKEIRILPRHGCFYVESIYKIEPYPIQLDPNQALSLDHGVDNWLTGVDTLGQSFIVDGKHLKSKNQWYNKQIAIFKENKPQGFWSKKLARITEKRSRQMRDAANQAARLIINHCLKHGIGTIVFGWNKGQKRAIDLGTKTNQKFVQIPTARLKKRIKQLCDRYGLQFVETEEYYTSKVSFLDRDFLPNYGEKPDQWEPSGKRIQRGLYRSSAGDLINADCHGAANILRKVSGRLKLNLSQLSRGALTTPLRVRFWTP